MSLGSSVFSVGGFGEVGRDRISFIGEGQEIGSLSNPDDKHDSVVLGIYLLRFTAFTQLHLLPWKPRKDRWRCGGIWAAASEN